jgi:hypothetical protein
MKQRLKNIIKGTALYRRFKSWKNERQILEAWEQAGKPAPPPHLIKQQVLRRYAKKHGLRVLVETGTYLGDMIEAMRPHFELIYSIELSEELFKKALQRFATAKNVELVHGDSGVQLPDLVKKLKQPALFWLDGHYSSGFTAKAEKETPIYEELNCIFSTPERRHVIIIDDARCFGVTADYPTLAELKRFVETKCPEANVVVEYDSIRITQR